MIGSTHYISHIEIAVLTGRRSRLKIPEASWDIINTCIKQGKSHSCEKE